MYASPTVPLSSATLAPFAASAPPPPTSSACCDDDSHDHSPHEHGASINTSPHANDISSITIPLPVFSSEEELREGRLGDMLKELIWEGQLPGSPAAVDQNAPILDLLRTKGFFLVQPPSFGADQPAPPARAFILQGVRETFDITEMPFSAEKRDGEEERETIKPKLVLIGRGLGAGQDVSRRFLEALAVHGEEGVVEST
jgi:hypothetical protein